MNIFVLDLDPKKCAQYHCDKHVVKMLLEHAQMMSTICRLQGLDVGYKSTHANHPCTIWARESMQNYVWLYTMNCYLNDEYKLRYNHTKNHKSFDLAEDLPVPNLPNIPMTPFVKAMKNFPECYSIDDPVLAYRQYYMNHKRQFCAWKTEQPAWFV